MCPLLTRICVCFRLLFLQIMHKFAVLNWKQHKWRSNEQEIVCRKSWNSSKIPFFRLICTETGLSQEEEKKNTEWNTRVIRTLEDIIRTDDICCYSQIYNYKTEWMDKWKKMNIEIMRNRGAHKNTQTNRTKTKI